MLDQVHSKQRTSHDSSFIPYIRGSPTVISHCVVLVLMYISGSRIYPVELGPLRWLLGHCKLRSEGRGGPILLVPEVISFQFPPLWESPSTMSSSIASCHAYSLHCVAQALASVRCLGRPCGLLFLLYDGVQSVTSPRNPFTWQPQQGTPPTDEATIKPSPETPCSLSPDHNTSPPDCHQGRGLLCARVLSPAGDRDCDTQLITTIAAQSHITWNRVFF